VTWLCIAKVQFGLAHRTVRWCIGQCPVRQAKLRWIGHSREKFGGVRLKFIGLSGGAPDCPVGHQTVRWANGWLRNGRPRNPRATRGLHQWSAGGTGQCPVRQPIPRTNGRMRQNKKEIAHRTATMTVRWRTGLSGAPPDRNNLGLPYWSLTAPSCLGVIKGTPRRMEE
jgi:hypothetical protein